MKLIKEIFVPIDARYLMTPIMAKQSDFSSRFFKVHLTRDGEEIPPTEWNNVALVAICITRSDGQSKAFTGIFNSADNTFELPLPLWAVENPGEKNYFDVMIQYKNDDGEDAVVRSALVSLSIQKAAYKSSDVSEDTEKYDILTGLISQVQTAIQSIPRPIEVTIAASKWANKTATLTVSDNPIIGTITAESDVQVIFDDNSAEAVINCGISATTIGAGTITLTCETTPTTAVAATIIIMN